MANEIVRLYWNTQASPLASDLLESGTFTLTFGGQETSSLDYNASSATIQAALEALSSIGAGNVSVSSVADGFTIEFIGALANTNVGAVTATLTAVKQKADTITIVVTQAGAVDVPTSPSNSTTTNAVAPVNEVQTVDYGGAASGTFDLNGNSSSASVDVSNGSSLQTALDTLFGSGNAAAASNGMGGYTVTFQGSLAGTPIALMSVSNNMTDGSPSVAASVDGVTGVHQVDQCTFSTGAAVAGAFTWEGGPKSHTDTPTISGAVVTGSASVGLITTTWDDYNSHSAAAVSNTDIVSAVGQQHIQTVTLADSPTEGTFAISCGAQSGNCAYDVSGTDLATAFGQAANNGTSYEGSGTGPWTITSVGRIVSPGVFTGADGQNGGGHLRKAMNSTQIVVVQAGVTAAGGAGVSALMLVRGVV